MQIIQGEFYHSTANNSKSNLKNCHYDKNIIQVRTEQNTYNV